MKVFATTCWWHELSQDAPTAAVLGEPEAPQIRYKRDKSRSRIHQPGMYAVYFTSHCSAGICRKKGLRVCFPAAFDHF